MGGFLTCALVLKAVESVVSKRTENLVVPVACHRIPQSA